MRGDAIPFSVRPLVASVLFGMLLGACGGGGSDSGHLEPALGQGNAEWIRAEYAAALKAAEQGPTVSSRAAQPAAEAVAATDATGTAAVGSAAGAGDASPASAGRQAASVSLPGSPVAGDSPLTQAAHPVGKEGREGEAAWPLPVSTRAEALLHAQPFHPLAREVVEKVNDIRARPQRCGDQEYPPAAPLVWNARVAYAALLESEWMVKHNTFSHQWEDGKYVWDRFDMADYAWSKADENIAAGFSTLDKAMQAWLESPSHCKAMMRPDIREIGLSVLPGRDGSRYNSWWTMALGTPAH